jgi:hypothetical protein
VAKEGRILQADPRLQAVSRFSRPDKEEYSRQIQKVHSDLATRPNTTNHFILFLVIFIV